jgi:hypothetical protein
MSAYVERIVHLSDALDAASLLEIPRQPFQRGNEAKVVENAGAKL